ncbi:MAG: pilus assembly protein CpaD [Alphaproteobacteria bacterium]|nr:MAG: pilus assembly protein CpaD [Alphaproteobacteria bacterium]
MLIANNSKLAKAPAIALALSLGLVLSGCGGMPTNRSLYSTKQAVVERTNYTFDVRSGQGGLDISEQQRLSAWFETMELGFGDRVSIEDPMASEATRDAVNKLAGRHGILVEDGAPVTSGFVQPGFARVVLTRSTASVPGCPDWSAKSDMNYNNGTHPGYGCATNSNLAAMVANPQDLIEGQKGNGETVIMSSTKAIDTYREAKPTGSEGLKSNSTGGK